MTTREKIQYFLDHERPGFEGGLLASTIAEAIEAKTDTVSAELRKMRALGLAQVVGETRENNRKAVLWATQTPETPAPATPATPRAPELVAAVSELQRMTLDEALEDAEKFRLTIEATGVDWPTAAEVAERAYWDSLPVEPVADPASAVLEPAVVATPDLATFEATAAALGFRPGEPVEVFDGCHGTDGLGPYVGVGQIVATPEQDPSLADGEYRVKLPGADMTLLGPNGDVFEAGELRPAEKVSS